MHVFYNCSKVRTIVSNAMHAFYHCSKLHKPSTDKFNIICQRALCTQRWHGMVCVTTKLSRLEDWYFISSNNNKIQNALDTVNRQKVPTPCLGGTEAGEQGV